jgi:hypothetical protein
MLTMLPRDVMATNKRNQYWSALHAVRAEYRSAVGDNAEMRGPTLPQWVEQRYGLRMGQDGSGNYTQDYTVVDPKRFMLFQLNYFK